MNYVLVTAARNEERVIAETMRSVVAQTRLPLRWVIVDDGSSDRTREIVEKMANGLAWITLVRRPARAERSFAGKANAVTAGLEHVEDLRFDAMGNLDADVTFDPDYFEFLLGKLGSDSGLGIVGTPFTEEGDYDSHRDSYEGENYVAGPCQLFRYGCFQEIGGYLANAAGGVDWIAVMTARMKGWRVRSYPEKRFHHHRSMGTAERGMLGALFSYGEKDYYLGNSPVWQLFRVAYRILKKPRLTGGLALLLGYSWAAARRTRRAVSPELMRFHRQEQMMKLKAVGKSVLRLRKPDNFALTTASSDVAGPGAANISVKRKLSP